MRVTGPWNKIPESEYDKIYYAVETSKDTFLEWSRRGHSDSHEDTYGFMRHAKSKYTTLTEAFKSGISIAKTWKNAYIFKGDDQIGVISLPSKKMNYVAEYKSGNKTTYLKKDGTVFKGEAKSKKVINAHIKILQSFGKSRDGGQIEAVNMNDLRRKMYHKFGGISPLDRMIVYIDGKEISCVSASKWDRWVWWPINEKMKFFNPTTGYLLKE